MEKIQCTFRLPQNIVELIDSQEGKTRTDKLLSLLDLGKDNVIQNVIKTDDTFLERLDSLEKKVNALEGKKTSVVNSDSPNMNTDEDMIIERIKSYKIQDGLSAKDIANKLNELGYLTVALKPFTKGSVEGIIRRKF